MYEKSAGSCRAVIFQAFQVFFVFLFYYPHPLSCSSWGFRGGQFLAAPPGSDIFCTLVFSCPFFSSPSSAPPLPHPSLFASSLLISPLFKLWCSLVSSLHFPSSGLRPQLSITLNLHLVFLIPPLPLPHFFRLASFLPDSPFLCNPHRPLVATNAGSPPHTKKTSCVSLSTHLVNRAAATVVNTT